MSDKGYAYLLGVYLGDGHIAENGRTYRLTIYQDARYPNIIEEIEARLKTLFPLNKVKIQKKHDTNCYEIMVHSNNLHVLFPSGKQNEGEFTLSIDQRIAIEAHPKSFVRGLIHSDGSFFVRKVGKYKYPSYQFTNNSLIIVQLLCKTLKRLDIEYKVVTSVGRYNVCIQKREAVAQVYEFVGIKS